MRKAIKEVISGAAAAIDDYPTIYNIEILQHLKEEFDKWSEPTAESALSEKERKNRGCC